LLIAAGKNSELTLLVDYPRRDQSEPDRYFEVQGVVDHVRWRFFTIAVWSEHKHLTFYVLIKGHLESKKGEVWWLVECALA
jgi:hypothetical protein